MHKEKRRGKELRDLGGRGERERKVAENEGGQVEEMRQKERGEKKKRKRQRGWKKWRKGWKRTKKKVKKWS